MDEGSFVDILLKGEKHARRDSTGTVVTDIRLQKFGLESGGQNPDMGELHDSWRLYKGEMDIWEIHNQCVESDEYLEFQWVESDEYLEL